MRLGPYEILSALGSGGMGEVYRARDSKLGRDVAIKILPEQFVADGERVARFEREAQLLAALNHPHIGTIYGLEQADATRFLVLELVDGETLATRIARGPMPFAEARGLARQITDALEAAHDKGIIHRDLKPANIMLTADGAVKVLDFGLAKHDPPVASGQSGGLSHSPTLTAATQAGVILGTAAYMSPEQAKGRAADKRSDVWAFGCVFYELLTATGAFSADDLSETLACVITREPDWTRLPNDVPAGVRALLKRCLDKDRRTRIADISTVRYVMDDATDVTQPGGALPPVGAGRPVTLAVAGAAIAVAAALATWVMVRPRAAALQPVMRLSVELGADMAVAPLGANIQISPDGRTLAFVGQKSGGLPQLYVRHLDQLDATLLPGTEDASNPFFSPDGQWIAFFAARKLKKIATTGGAAVTLCDAPAGRGGAWAEDGTIVFLPINGSGVSLVRVSSAGGKPEPLLSLGEGEVTQRWPQMLPSGKGVLYTASNVASGFGNANIVAQALPSGARKVVLRRGLYGRYLPSGHLVYVQDGTLFAAPFDLDRLETSGPSVPVLEGVASNASGGSAGAAQMSVSNNGTLAYLAGTSITRSGLPLSWLDRAGKVSTLRATPAVWTNPAFSPDGHRLALEIMDSTSNLWVFDLARETLERLTFDASDSASPKWTPDGRRIVFAATRADSPGFNLFWRPADGTGEVQRLTESKNLQFPVSWHPSGKFLAFTETRPGTSEDLMILPMEGNETSGWKPGTPFAFLATSAAEMEPTFSPDGRWIAYSSQEAGRMDVYVRPFPGPGGKWLISSDAGMYPMWSRTRNELFFVSGDQHIMVVPYAVDGDSFRAGKPQPWSNVRFASRPRQRSVDVHPDGDRFAIAAAASGAPARQDKVVLILNFFDELTRAGAGARR